MRDPQRAEIWSDADDVLFLVISADWFNSSTMHDVICLQVRTGDLTVDDPGPYAIVTGSGENQHTIYADDLQIIEKASLIRPVAKAPPALIQDIEDSLREILTPTSQPPVVSGRGQPHVEPNAVLFADLWINGEETPKPIVIISSAEYGRLVANSFVVACRVTSNTTAVRRSDVVVGPGSKVVGSAVMTVPAGRITLRNPTGLPRVPAPLAAEVRAKVFDVLGL